MTVDRKITRNRISYSCQTCRRRKVKCDKTHPICGGCQKTGEQCIWSDTDNVNNNDDLQDIHSLNSKKRKGLDDGTAENVSHSEAIQSLQSIEKQLAHLTVLMRDIQRSTPPESVNLTPDDKPFNQSQFHSNDSLLDGENAPWSNIQRQLGDLNTFLRSRGGTGDFSQPGSETMSQRNTHQVDSNVWPRKDVRDSTGPKVSMMAAAKEMSIRLADIDFLTPPDEETNALTRSWLSCGYAIFPIVSPSVVFKKWEAFRHWYKFDMDKGAPNPDDSFMPLMYAIQYIGLGSMSQKAVLKWFSWTKRDRLMIGLRSRFLKSLRDCNYPEETSFFPFIASVMMRSMFLHEDSGVGNAMEVASLLRVAQQMAFHRERAMKSLSHADGDTKRKAWWELVHLDASLSISSGLPPLLNEQFWDTDLPTELKAFRIGSDHAYAYETEIKEKSQRPDDADDPGGFEGSSMVSVYSLVAKARYIVAQATQRLLKINMAAKTMNKDDMKEVRKTLNETNISVRALIARIPSRGIPELDFVPPSAIVMPPDFLSSMGDPITQEEIDYYEGKPVSDSYRKKTLHLAQYHRASRIAFHKWARIFLSMMLERLTCVSYAPFLKNAKSKLWAVARNCALRDSHAFMRKLISLATDPDLSRFRWTWPWMFQPMHAVIILLIDVFERPISEEAPRSRALIDKMFSLSSPENGIVGGEGGVTTAIPLQEGGKDAWEMLRQLRKRAWQKARLDPNVLWTEEDQLAVGLGVPLNENDIFKRSLREDIIYMHKKRAETNDSELTTENKVPKPIPFAASLSAIKHELLHPTQAGIPGDTMTGPLDLSVFGEQSDRQSLSNVLIRARCDQQPMPFLEGNGDHPNQDAISAKLVQHFSSRSNEQDHDENNGSQVQNMGELIRRIRESKITKESSTGEQLQQPTDTQHISQHRILASNGIQKSGTDVVEHIKDNISESQEAQAGCCGYNQISQLENAALADINDEFVSQSVDGRRFEKEIMMADYALRPDSSRVPQSFEKEQRKTWTAVAFPSPNNPVGVSSNVEDYNPTLAPHSDTPLPQVGTPYVSATLDSSTEFNFDWARWDEVFGQFSGFEDMLMMDAYSEAHDVGPDIDSHAFDGNGSN